ncbi:MAG: hypothetical protein PHY27_05515 [Parabacteroides sp.]|nr:hypothetical protein [Parabacteroides sp.]
MINLVSIDSGPTNILIELNNGGNPWCLEELEDAIIQSYNTSRKYENDKCLVELRSLFLNKITLSHQEQILKPLLEFNESLREALREMYDRAHEMYDEISNNVLFLKDGEVLEITAECFLSSTYPKLHPIQNDSRQNLWYALQDSGLNPLYDSGVSQTLCLPFDMDISFDSFIGMDLPSPNWNEGLDQELTKSMNLIYQFHYLFIHMNFALTDLIYVREFRTEIKIQINKGN